MLVSQLLCCLEDEVVDSPSRSLSARGTLANHMHFHVCSAKVQRGGAGDFTKVHLLTQQGVLWLCNNEEHAVTPSLREKGHHVCNRLVQTWVSVDKVL